MPKINFQIDWFKISIESVKIVLSKYIVRQKFLNQELTHIFLKNICWFFIYVSLRKITWVWESWTNSLFLELNYTL